MAPREREDRPPAGACPWRRRPAAGALARRLLKAVAPGRAMAGTLGAALLLLLLPDLLLRLGLAVLSRARSSARRSVTRRLVLMVAGAKSIQSGP
jgi:hypothetical protein